MPQAAAQSVHYRSEAVLSLVYFCLYVGYLFLHLESETGHWLTLVVLPFVLLYLYQRSHGLTLQDALASVGLRKSTWRQGIVWAFVLGLDLSILQLFLSHRSEEMWHLITTGQALYSFPLAFMLLLLTAGFTEEFFFRGIVQTRLGALLNGKVRAVLVTSVLFGLYHLPYAYLHPRWPSHGDWASALEASMGQGIIGGLILGTVYERSNQNLVASVLVHALINTLPAMTLIKFGNG